MEFYERNQEALQHESEVLEKMASEWGNNAPMLYLQNGNTMVRILPPYSALGVFFRQIVKHRIQIGRRVEIFACPAAEANLPCAICVKGQELTESKDEAKMKFAKENLRPRSQYLYNVLVHSAPADRKGAVPIFGKVYVLEAGVTVHRQIISLDQDPAAGWADITNPEQGVNIIIKRTGQNLDTKYEVHPHGAGRTNLFLDCQTRGIDPNSLTLINLDEVYALPDTEKVEEWASQVGSGMFSYIPSPRPAFQTVSPAVAVGAPPAPVPAAPAPVAAPISKPVAPPVVPMPKAIPLPPQPVVQSSETRKTEIECIPVPQPPYVPAPPSDSE